MSAAARNGPVRRCGPSPRTRPSVISEARTQSSRSPRADRDDVDVLPPTDVLTERERQADDVDRSVLETGGHCDQADRVGRDPEAGAGPAPQTRRPGRIEPGAQRDRQMGEARGRDPTARPEEVGDRGAEPGHDVGGPEAGREHAPGVVQEDRGRPPSGAREHEPGHRVEGMMMEHDDVGQLHGLRQRRDFRGVSAPPAGEVHHSSTGRPRGRDEWPRHCALLLEKRHVVTAPGVFAQPVPGQPGVPPYRLRLGQDVQHAGHHHWWGRGRGRHHDPMSGRRVRRPPPVAGRRCSRGGCPRRSERRARRVRRRRRLHRRARLHRRLRWCRPVEWHFAPWLRERPHPVAKPGTSPAPLEGVPCPARPRADSTPDACRRSAVSGSDRPRTATARRAHPKRGARSNLRTP